jgi:lipoprotein-anchoring transpeptidase ErfK/SrfK
MKSAVWLTVSLVVCLALTGMGVARPQLAAKRMVPPKALPCGDPMAFQVLLDRQGFSPGEIDGQPGINFSHALAALQAARQLQPTGQPDCDTWKALDGDSAEPVITTYTVTQDDVNGPFAKTIPRDIALQAKLPALVYQSPLELLAERFHASPALLRQLNHDAPIAAGRPIQVPAVTPFEAGVRPAPDANSGDITIQVSRAESAVRAMRSDGTLVFFAPASTGSVHDPLPIGDYKIRGVDWHPAFHYNPDLFWDAKQSDEKATIKPGPNNPVGVVWIALDLEHYGLHGTPEPGHIGHTESHGCVRLTNWDAVRLASMVKPGTTVQFR